MKPIFIIVGAIGAGLAWHLYKNRKDNIDVNIFDRSSNNKEKIGGLYDNDPIELKGIICKAQALDNGSEDNIYFNGYDVRNRDDRASYVSQLSRVSTSATKVANTDNIIIYQKDNIYLIQVMTDAVDSLNRMAPIIFCFDKKQHQASDITKNVRFFCTNIERSISPQINIELDQHLTKIFH